MLKLRINPLVKEDLLEIKNNIEENLQSPVAAQKLLSKIIAQCQNFKSFPNLGLSLNAKIEIPTDYRYIICENYLIFYKYDKSYVSIYRVLYAKRDYLKILFEK